MSYYRHATMFDREESILTPGIQQKRNCYSTSNLDTRPNKRKQQTYIHMQGACKKKELGNLWILQEIFVFLISWESDINIHQDMRNTV